MSARYLIYLRGAVEAGTLGPAAGLSRADATRVATSKLPLPVAVAGSPDEARERIERLRGAGLDGFAITPEAVRGFAPLEVERAVRDDDGFVWSGRGFQKHLRRGDVRMIVVGKIHTVKESRVESAWDPLAHAALGMAVMGGPAACARLTPRETSTVTRNEESFCCLFRSADEAWIIPETRFRYRETLPELRPTREQSFLEVVRMVREAHPEALFNETLYRHPQTIRAASGSVRRLGSALVGVTQWTTQGSSQEKSIGCAYLLFLTRT